MMHRRTTFIKTPRANAAPYRAAVLLLVAIAAQAAAAERSCPVAAPVAVVMGRNWYGDRAGSQVDENALRAHQTDIQPLRVFVTGLISALEEGQSACAQDNLRAWARAHALLQEPSNFAGVRERLRFGMGISFAALRMEASGHALDVETRAWIGAINAAIARNFEKRGIVDNLYVWSGAAAGLANLVAADPHLDAFADKVWRNAIEAIGFDGTLNSELRRGRRALLYHAYYLVGLLILRETRVASESDLASVKRLYAWTRSGSCDVKSVAPAKGLPLDQFPINANDIAAMSVFRADLGPAPCDGRPGDFSDALRGGDLRATFSAMRARAAHSSAHGVPPASLR